MRRVVAALFVTLDGVVESPEKWQPRYVDEELGEAILGIAAESDAMLLGRRTYQQLAEFWPSQNSDVPMADFMNDTPKHVVSTTLKTVEWAYSRLLTGDLTEELAQLKEQRGENILIFGSPTLVRSLLREGLLDELRLLVHPLVVGGGTSLFENGGYGTALTLVDSRTFRTGVVSLTYAPAWKAGDA